MAGYTAACTACRHSWVSETVPDEYEGRCPECGDLTVKNYGRRIVEAADVDDALIEYAISEADGFYPVPTPIDWEDLINRMDGGGIDFGDSWDTPAIRKIQRAVREARRAV